MPRITIYVDEALHIMMKQRPDINYSAVCKPAIVQAVNTPKRDILDISELRGQWPPLDERIPTTWAELTGEEPDF
jgi:hypothetical protein